MDFYTALGRRLGGALTALVVKPFRRRLTRSPLQPDYRVPEQGSRVGALRKLKAAACVRCRSEAVQDPSGSPQRNANFMSAKSVGVIESLLYMK